MKYKATCKKGHDIIGNAYATPEGFVCSLHREEEQKLAKSETGKAIPQKELDNIKRQIWKGV